MKPISKAARPSTDVTNGSTIKSELERGAAEQLIARVSWPAKLDFEEKRSSLSWF